MLHRAVLVSALGYFVDAYDLLLFSVVRVPSLRGIGVPAAQLLDVGVLLLNAQMIGMLLGGVLWGVLGDKRGRVSVLFGSIALYSVANLANAFVGDVPSYAALRFLAGVGLAGELGAAITLVSEIMPKETRGYGTTVLTAFGILGGVAAALVGGILPWQGAYLVGGGLGLLLLAARYKLAEPGLFDRLRSRPGGVRRGSLRLLFASRARATRYAACVILGVPTWFALGIVVTFSPELGQALGVTALVAASVAVVAFEWGFAAGNLCSGLLSQRWRTRWWVMLGFLALTPVALFALVLPRGLGVEIFYALVAFLGFAVGSWVVFLSMAAELFGTNLRATVTTTAPNFSRGATVPLTLAFQTLVPGLGFGRSTLLLGVGCVLLCLVALRRLDETHGRDLDFLET